MATMDEWTTEFEWGGERKFAVKDGGLALRLNTDDMRISFTYSANDFMNTGTTAEIPLILSNSNANKVFVSLLEPSLAFLFNILCFACLIIGLCCSHKKLRAAYTDLETEQP